MHCLALALPGSTANRRWLGQRVEPMTTAELVNEFHDTK